MFFINIAMPPEAFLFLGLSALIVSYPVNLAILLPLCKHVSCMATMCGDVECRLMRRSDALLRDRAFH